jgi:hypothetical protein
MRCTSSVEKTMVFGREHVRTNVNLYRGKDLVGEAHALVIYAAN